MKGAPEAWIGLKVGQLRIEWVYIEDIMDDSLRRCIFLPVYEKRVGYLGWIRETSTVGELLSDFELNARYDSGRLESDQKDVEFPLQPPKDLDDLERMFQIDYYCY